MRATVIKAPAGLGKTQSVVKRIAHSPHSPFEVYASTHRLAEEWRESILRSNPHKRVIVISGRSHPDVAGTPMCRMHKEAEQLSAAGFSVYENLCKKRQGKDQPPLKCPHFDSCGYLQQFGHADVYIYTHAHLPLERGALETWQPYVVVIDESFFQSCITQVKLNIALLTHPALPAAARSLCHDIAAELRNGKPQHLDSRMMLARSEKNELSSALRALDDAQPQLTPGMTSQQLTAALKTSVSFAPVRTLLSHLDTELTFRTHTQSVDVDPAAGEITVHHRHAIKRFNRADQTQPTIVILDASASQEIIGQFFEIEKFVLQDVGRQARVIQCHSTRCSTTSLAPERNGDPKSKRDAQRRLAELTIFIQRLCAGNQRVLVVGPVAIVGNARTGAKPLIEVPAKCELAHFNAIRGVDRWKDFNSVVIIGRNEPPVEAVEDMARALYYDQRQPLRRTGKWDVQPRGYRLADQTLGVDVNVHADPRIQAVVEQVREHESLQAIDRLRLIHSVTVKNVFVLSSIPLDIDVHETRTWDELIFGTRLERAWEGQNGILPLNPAWLAARFPDLWSTADAAKKDVGGEIKKGHFSNSISIRKMTLFEHDYKTAGQRRWSRCLSRSDNLAWVKAELEALTGEKLTVRPARTGQQSRAAPRPRARSTDLSGPDSRRSPPPASLPAHKTPSFCPTPAAPRSWPSGSTAHGPD